MRTSPFISRKDFVPLEEDADGAWMSNEEKVAAFLSWFTDDPVAEAPLKLIVMLSSCKNLLRRVSTLFKSYSEEGTVKIKWQGPYCGTKLPQPNNLLSILVNSTRDRDGRLRDRLPKLKSIDCSYLDTLMELNGCPSGLEELDCSESPLVYSLSPLAACTNLRKLNLSNTKVSNLKPLSGCVKLEWLGISDTPVADLSPLTCLYKLKVVDLSFTPVFELSHLSTLFHLEYLDCCYTLVSDLSPLSKCTELKTLNIYDTKIKSLTPLLQCKKLKYLNHSKLKDLSDEQTEGYICFLTGLMPQVELGKSEYSDWFHNLPVQLQHFYDNY